MKILFISIAAAAVAFAACNGSNTNPSRHGMNDHRMMNNSEMDSMHQSMNASTMNGGDSKMQFNNVVFSYIQLKNALVDDNAKDAAAAGAAVATAIENVDMSAATPAQKKIYDEVKMDVKEHGEHIAENANKIDHQREHFETLSKDVYDLVKVFGSDKTLYYTNCPMYNKNRGGNWLSEVQEIKNPYMGKKMTTCGTVKEEIK